MVTVDASGDGIDSNGDIEVTGGELYISGPTSNGDGAIDCDGSATITGGIVVAAGSTGMAENFGTASTQGSILVNLSGSAGQTITLKDSDGNILASFTPAKAFGCVVVSAPGVAQGGTYTIAAGGASTTVTMESLIYGSGMGGGMGDPGDMGGGQRPAGRCGRPRQPRLISILPIKAHVTRQVLFPLWGNLFAPGKFTLFSLYRARFPAILWSKGAAP